MSSSDQPNNINKQRDLLKAPFYLSPDIPENSVNPEIPENPETPNISKNPENFPPDSRFSPINVKFGIRAAGIIKA